MLWHTGTQLGFRYTDKERVPGAEREDTKASLGEETSWMLHDPSQRTFDFKH